MKVRIANVDTVLPQWIGKEVEVLTTFRNIYGKSFYEVKHPEAEDDSLILSENQVQKEKM